MRVVPRESRDDHLPMRFSRVVFRIAAAWGFLSVAPMFFLLDRFGRDNPPPVTHPEFFYGFAGLTLAWQIVFLIVASDPARFRPSSRPPSWRSWRGR